MENLLSQHNMKPSSAVPSLLMLCQHHQAVPGIHFKDQILEVLLKSNSRMPPDSSCAEAKSITLAMLKRFKMIKLECKTVLSDLKSMLFSVVPHEKNLTGEDKIEIPASPRFSCTALGKTYYLSGQVSSVIKQRKSCWFYRSVMGMR